MHQINVQVGSICSWRLFSLISNPGFTLPSGEVTSKMSLVPLNSQDQKIAPKALLLTTTSQSNSETHFLETGNAEMRWEARGMDSQRCLANPLSAPQAFDIQHTHSRSHTYTLKCCLVIATEHERWKKKNVSVRILILKSKVFWFWFCHNRAWSSLLSASLLAGGQSVCGSVWELVCVCSKVEVCEPKKERKKLKLGRPLPPWSS